MSASHVIRAMQLMNIRHVLRNRGYMLSWFYNGEHGWPERWFNRYLKPQEFCIPSLEEPQFESEIERIERALGLHQSSETQHAADAGKVEWMRGGFW
jgi:hypothetical protein